MCIFQGTRTSVRLADTEAQACASPRAGLDEPVVHLRVGLSRRAGVACVHEVELHRATHARGTCDELLHVDDRGAVLGKEGAQDVVDGLRVGSPALEATLQLDPRRGRSDGTRMALGWHSGGTRAALSGGNRAAIRLCHHLHFVGGEGAVLVTHRVQPPVNAPPRLALQRGDRVARRKLEELVVRDGGEADRGHVGQALAALH